MLNVRNLSVSFFENGQTVRAVRGISFTLKSGTVTGIVGESGSGKSMTALALTGLLPNGADAGGKMHYKGKTYYFNRQQEWQSIRGKEIGIVFQDPAASLNPLMTIGRQVSAPLLLHKKYPPKEAQAEAVNILSRLGIIPAAKRYHQYPHQLSGGLQQRVMLAAAIACKPAVLIADEPTTALDVTVQAQLLQLLRKYTIMEKAALCLISHDLGVIAQLADEVLVMCGGTVVETGSVTDVMKFPLHPYTRYLLAALPRLDGKLNLTDYSDDEQVWGGGCVFAHRCPNASSVCQKDEPLLSVKITGREVACFHADIHGLF